MFKNNYGNNATAFEGQEESIEDPRLSAVRREGLWLAKPCLTVALKQKVCLTLPNVTASPRDPVTLRQTQ
jgi:hypothetical protein